MLYLVRKEGESIIINNTIEVKVVDIKGSSVKLGFEFPQNATVLRKEVHDRIIEENRAAADAAWGEEEAGLDLLEALASAVATSQAPKVQAPTAQAPKAPPSPQDEDKAD